MNNNVSNQRNVQGTCKYGDGWGYVRNPEPNHFSPNPCPPNFPLQIQRTNNSPPHRSTAPAGPSVECAAPGAVAMASMDTQITASPPIRIPIAPATDPIPKTIKSSYSNQTEPDRDLSYGAAHGFWSGCWEKGGRG